MSGNTLLIWILSIYGITFLIADSELLGLPRNELRKISFFDKLLNCYFCVGFWVSLALSLLVLPLMWTQKTYLSVLFGTFSGASGAYILDLLTGYLITNIEKNTNSG